MKGLRQHPCRVIGRLFLFVVLLVIAAADYLIRCTLRSQKFAFIARAHWLQRASRRHLRFFKIQVHATGQIPTSGVLICNHLSYLDIIVLAALTPVVFVAKREVKSWPVLGWFAQMSGTLFVDRERRTHVGQVADEIQSALQRGALVVLFPEGTSSDGKTVLPFKSSLLEPATRRDHPLTTGLLKYEIEDGDVSEEICYWGNHVFFPHLLNLLSKKNIHASVHFMQIQQRNTDRKELALQLQSQLLQLKAIQQ